MFYVGYKATFGRGNYISEKYSKNTKLHFWGKYSKNTTSCTLSPSHVEKKTIWIYLKKNYPSYYSWAQWILPGATELGSSRQAWKHWYHVVQDASSGYTAGEEVEEDCRRLHMRCVQCVQRGALGLITTTLPSYLPASRPFRRWPSGEGSPKLICARFGP